MQKKTLWILLSLLLLFSRPGACTRSLRRAGRFFAGNALFHSLFRLGEDEARAVFSGEEEELFYL